MKLSQEEIRQLNLQVMYNPPSLVEAAEAIDPNFVGGYKWDSSLVSRRGEPAFTRVSQFEYNPGIDDNGNIIDYTPPSDEDVLASWKSLYDEYEAKYYQLERSTSYPLVVEQLDKLYHDINSGLFGEEVKNGQFFTTLSEVKNTFPKA